MEIWKDISGYEGYYQVSDRGQVKSLDRIIIRNNQHGFYNWHFKGRILKLCFNKKGYLQCGLSRNNKRNPVRVHRLVAQAFIDNPECKPEVNHINGKKEDCSVDNLEWMTTEKNFEHACKNGLINIDKIGKDHPGTKIVIQMDILGNIIKRFDCIRDVTRELGIDCSGIVKVCKGINKTAGGFVWCYG